MAADSGASEETPEICRAVPDEEEGRRLNDLHRSADAGHDADAWSFHRYKARGHHRHRAVAGFEMENSFFLLIYVSAGEIDEGGLKKIIACVIIIL